MKKQLLFLFAALLPLVASAQTKVEIDGIWYNLTSETQQAEVTKGGDYSGSITIPTTVTYGGVEYSVTSIGERTFYQCSSLTAINIPESVTYIGDYAFSYCSSLTAINIPEGVTSIGLNAFRNCSSLTDITIPEESQLTSIGRCAFEDCSSLTAINIPESVTSIGGYAFCRCSSLTTITIPEGVTSIGDYAFQNCSSLTDITIPESVTSIGNHTFQNCSSLTAINIPEGVTSIVEYAFCRCESLTAITLPEGVTSIGDYAFYFCSSLTAITCNAITPPIVASTTFPGVDKSIPVYVPAGSVEAYKSASYWKAFTNIVPSSLGKCATPTIGYADGKVVFACDTEGATVKSSIKENVTGDYRDMEVAFIPTYTITAYATKEQYENSDIATLTLCWIPCTEEYESEETGILTIPSKPVLISTQGGTITLTGLAAGTAVAAYNTAGTLLATATATDGTATLDTNLEAGNIAIVKMGDYSIRIVIK